MPIRLLFAASVLLASAPAFAESVAAPAAAPAVAEPPAIEIVREGGVAEVWRSEGTDFAAYGPDGAPVVPTAERQALQALANAIDVQFIALAPPAAAEGAGVSPCGADGCVGGLAVLARVPVRNIAQYRLARQVGDGWLREPVAAPAACEPAYGHALAYSSDGHAWEVLLGYDCGRYLIRRDGVELATGHAAEPPAQAEFDALLGSAAAQ